MVLNLMAVAVFSLLASVVYVAARTQSRAALNDIRQAQALAIAEAGMEDAMRMLYVNSAWTTGFSSKAFANGFYSVSLSTDVPPRVTSTGYSPSTFLLGRAVRTVSAQTVFTPGACPYALFADDIVIDGKLDAYDPTTTLQPCSTCFTTGANTWANDNMTIGGAACPPTRLRGVASIGGGNALSGSAACAESGVVNSTESKTLPNWTGAGVSNFTVPANSTTTLYPGTYNYKKLTIKGVLNVDTSTGVVYINFDSNVSADSGCQINNLSKVPSRLRITDVSGNSGHTINLNCSTPLHAYLEGNANRFDIEQEVYGHYCGGSVKIASTTGKIGLVHYDIGGGVLTRVALKTGSSSWTQSYKRQ